jgi:hypothetical protein
MCETADELVASLTCRISFFTFASTLHFYNLRNPSFPQLIVPDVDNPFVPLPFNLLRSHDMDLASVQGSSTFFVDIGYEAKLDPKSSSAFMQCALLYTTRSTRYDSNTYAQLYRNTDLEANVFAAVQGCLVDAVNKGPKEARAESLGRLIKMLTSYRKYCSAGSHSGQLLPIYLLCAHKSDALVAGTNVRIDERVKRPHNTTGTPAVPA